MQGNTEQQQLTLISQLCGSLTPDVWPGVESLELFNKMELIQGQKRKVRCNIMVFTILLFLFLILICEIHFLSSICFR
jgi:hypothetical protein